MYLTRWNPFETLSELQEDVSRLFERRLSANNQGQQGQRSLLQADWYPAVDIHEDKEAYLFDIEAPGVSKDSFDVKVENNVLVIRGERKSREEKNEGNVHRIERSYGSFARSFTLPETADTEKVNAEYKDGVLHIKVAKKEALKPKQINVKVVS